MKIFKYLLPALTLLSASTFASGCRLSCDNSEGGLFVYGDYLYWQVSQDQMPYAAVLPGGIQRIIEQLEDGDSVVLKEKLWFEEPGFNWHSGFRLGVGYNDPCSCMDFDLSWTNLRFNKSSNVIEPSRGILPIANPLSSIFGFVDDGDDIGFASEASSKWKFRFDVVDARVGFDYCVTSCLNTRPFFGIKFAKINQCQNIEYVGFEVEENSVFVQNHRKNHFRGVGPTVGFDSAYQFYDNVYLTAGAAGSLVYGRFHVDEEPIVSFANNLISFEGSYDKKHRMRPVIEGNIGLQWNTCICNSYMVSLGASYEMQYWWNQWQAPASLIGSAITGGASPQGDLVLQGLTVKAELRF